MNDDTNIPLRLRIVRTSERADPFGTPELDPSIPMLTEVMDFQRSALDPEPNVETAAQPVPIDKDIDWQALKQQLQNSILESLLEKSDAFLAKEFQERVKPLLERTVSSMVQDLNIHLEQVLRDAVASAIADELNKLQHANPHDLPR
jgi:hypothetical protein